jgi:ABC-type nickel/cobalt efflux system permease component RcnA
LAVFLVVIAVVIVAPFVALFDDARVAVVEPQVEGLLGGEGVVGGVAQDCDRRVPATILHTHTHTHTHTTTHTNTHEHTHTHTHTHTHEQVSQQQVRERVRE